jgi:23S rRNA pseudouridine1911/1915/1917 synthase
MRLDKFLSERLAKVSRTRIQSAAKAGNIIVNTKPATASYKVKPGDQVSVVLPAPPHDYKLEPENIPLHVVFEDEQVVVVNKPAGMVVHPGSGNYSATLVNALLFHFAKLPLNAGQSDRPGLVHRIDKNTSGLLVIAKTEDAMSHLARQFFHHTIHRSYLALVWGTFDQPEATVNAHVGRHKRHRMMMDVYPDGDEGKEAITHFTVKESLGYVSLVECRLETGRTHQIRVHMQHIGHPVFNDEVYGGNRIRKGTVHSSYRQFIDNCFALCPRHALHAQSLGFVHPATEEWMQFAAPLPEDMDAVIAKWRKYVSSSLKPG